MSAVLRRYSREFLVVLLVTAPFIVLIVAGTLAIISSAWFIEIFAAMGACSLAAMLLVRQLRRAAAQPAPVAPPGSDGLSEIERQAMARVDEIARRAEAVPPADIEAIQALGREVIDTVATSLHANAKFAWASFTVPELLLAIENSARHLRKTFHQRVPLAHVARVSDLLHLRAFVSSHEGKLRAAMMAWRVIRMVKSPATAIVQEAKDGFFAMARTGSKDWLHGRLARVATEALGLAAIELYTGRLRRTIDEAEAELARTVPVPRGPVPVRILVAGQAKAGKSSLINALIGSVQAPVSPLPTGSGAQSYRFTDNSSFDLTLVETPALIPETVDKGGWSQGAGEFDLVLWVIDATHPARQADVAALRALRDYFRNAPHLAQPSVVIAVTCIEQLSPAREWKPPYDLARPTGPKAERIREALHAVAETLAQDREAVVPVSLADGEAPYNVDTLWAAITGQLSGATQIALGRALKQTAALNPLQWARQLYDGGRFIFFRR